MLLRRIATRVAVAACLGLCSQACEEYEVPSALPPPPVTVNYYAASAPEPVVVTVTAAPAARRADPPSSGIAECDAFFSKTRRCATQVTSSPSAFARFEHSLDVARREDRIVSRGGSEEARQRLVARCKAALAAYESAPCGRL